VVEKMKRNNYVKELIRDYFKANEQGTIPDILDWIIHHPVRYHETYSHRRADVPTMRQIQGHMRFMCEQVGKKGKLNIYILRR